MSQISVRTQPPQSAPDLSRGQYSVCSAGLKSWRHPAFTQAQTRCRALPWFAPSAGDRPFQTISLTWKRKMSHQESAALGLASLSSQLLISRGTFMCWREQPSTPTYLSPPAPLLDVDGSVYSCPLLSPELSLFSFLSVLFQGRISPTSLSLPYSTWVQPALLLTGHVHTPAFCPELTALTGAYHKIPCTEPWARGFLCLLFHPPLVWETLTIRAKKAAMTFENLFSFHHSTNA